MQQIAYDLSMFENRGQKPVRELRVAKAEKPRRDFSGLKAIALSALVLALAWGVLYSRAQVTELSAAIDAAQVELTDARSEYEYLSLTLESKTNLSTVEQIAKSQLGMTKLDKSQVTYISLTGEDSVVKPEGEVENLLSDIESGFLNLMEYIAP